MALKEGVLNKKYYQSFNGGVNSYVGARQIKDNESPSALNCDFYGIGGVGNRQGYTQLGAVADSRTKIYGMKEYHTSVLDQLVKAVSNGSNVALYASTGGAWTAATGNTFADATNLDLVQAGLITVAAAMPMNTSTDGLLFSFNGVDAMQKYDGTTVADHAVGTKGYYGAFYNQRLWCVDEQYKDTLNYSTQSPDATKPLDFTANGTSSNPGTITFRPGSGEVITGLKTFKNKLYVWFKNSIYRLYPSATAGQFTVELVTNAIGCVSHRSICQVGEDIFFAADDGVYSLGDVANYTDVRTTNKSSKVLGVFSGLSSTNKQKLVGAYHNFKYHLFYSLFGTSNDSCIVYDTRYGSWQDWRGISANSATTFTDSTGETNLFFGEPTTGKVQKMYSGSTDDGVAITSSWYSKSFDEGESDITKIYFDSTFNFGNLDGTINLSVIFDDTEVKKQVPISQTRPSGGFSRTAFGRSQMVWDNTDLAVGGFGRVADTTSVTIYTNKPLRAHAKAQKFAIQYKISTTGQWRLDSISQTLIPLTHYKFPSYLKVS